LVIDPLHQKMLKSPSLPPFSGVKSEL